MSKSAGNFFTVREIGEKYDLEAVRYFMLAAHYRSPLNFSQELIEQSKSALDRLYTAQANYEFLLEKGGTVDREPNEAEQKFIDAIPAIRERFIACMDDDMNTAGALGAIFDLVKEGNIVAVSGASTKAVKAALEALNELTGVLGLLYHKKNETPMEEFFDYSPEYDAALAKKGRDADRDALHAACDLANVYFLRQKEPRGLGHAVLRAKNFIGDEPFAVLYGDDIIFSEKPVTRQLMDTYEAYGRAAVGVKEVPRELLSKYCSMKAAPIEGSDTEFFVDDMIEKPKPGEEFSNLAILGRVLLTPEIFTILEHTAPGAGGELQLTDAMATYARAHGVTAKIFEGDRYDIGSKLGFAKANFVKALEHPETAAAFAEFVKNYRF